MSLSGGSGGGTVPPFDPSVTVDTTTTLGSGGGADWWGRAAIKRRASDGALVMAYYRATGHAANDGNVHMVFSDDDGASWTAEDTTLLAATIPDFNPSTAGGSEDAGEPWVYLCPNGDLLVHTWVVDYSVSTHGTMQWRSTDEGESWTEEGQVVFIDSGVSDDIVFSTDDDFVIDRVIYAGARVYSGGADGVPAAMILIRSDDNGVSWSKVSTIMLATEGSGSHGGQEVGLEYVGNGTIVAMLRDNDHTASYARRSTDMGATWGSLTAVTSTVGIAGRQRVYTLNHLAGEPGWWKDPRLMMVGFVHQSSGDSMPRRVCVWFSPDRGVTWTTPFYVDTTNDDGGYGDLFGKPDGTIGMVSYRGTLTAASLKQYDLSVTLAP